MAADSELDRIDPEPAYVTLTTGLEVEIVRMRTRQLFRLLKVLTHGAGPAMTQASLDFSAEPREFITKLVMLVLMSIPDAESETIAFLSSMCRPAGLTDKPANELTKQEKAANEALRTQFNKDLFNPDLDDLVDLVEEIITREAPEMQALGKKLQRVMALFTATGQDKEAPEETPDLTSSPEPSPERSTSSATSTDGPTSTSSPSRSAGSGSASKRRQRAGTASSEAA